MQTAATPNDQDRQEAKFRLDLLKGRRAQVAVQTIFERFGYNVSPYGYENYLSIHLKSMRSTNANEVVKKIRNSPDLFVYDGDSNQGYLLEVKATFGKETCYKIDKSKISNYQAQWGESILVVYCARSANIYCLPMSEVPKTNELNLEKDFKTLPHYFSRIDEQKYKEYIQEVYYVTSVFGSGANPFETNVSINSSAPATSNPRSISDILDADMLAAFILDGLFER